MNKKQTRDEYITRHLSAYKTPCCTAPVKAAGRARIICSDCGSDVSMEYFLLAEMFGKDYDHKQQMKHAQKERSGASKGEDKHRA